MHSVGVTNTGLCKQENFTIFLCLHNCMFTTNKLTAEQEYAKLDQTVEHPTAGLNEAAVL